jgi:DNA repair protein RadA/Sms
MSVLGTNVCAMATAKTKSSKPAGFKCGECGWQTTKWVGRCGECQAWGTLEEMGVTTARTVASGHVTSPATPIGDVDVSMAAAIPTGIDELDRVLGGGLVPGAVILLAGEPGVGKSTLLLEVAARAGSGDTPALYITGEESAAQVRLRAERIGALVPNLYLASETDLGAALSHVETVKPHLLVVDSVQTLASLEVDGQPGGVTQVREVAGSLIRVAKEHNISTILVGHVTKDGTIAGPRVLEHLVDVVLQVEGDRHTRLRLVRAAKNRYGAADEVGCFELNDDGLTGISDPSGLFVSGRNEPVPGTCLTMSVEGTRPLLAEVQALVATTNVPTPRRATSGLDNARMAMLLAVLERRVGLPLSSRDVHTATVGGMRITEPAVDLAVALAVASAARDFALPSTFIALGEVGLAGEVRRVTGTRRRLAEAARLGITEALVPKDSGPYPAGMKIHEVETLRAAMGVISRITGHTRENSASEQPDF